MFQDIDDTNHFMPAFERVRKSFLKRVGESFSQSIHDDSDQHIKASLSTDTDLHNSSEYNIYNDIQDFNHLQSSSGNIFFDV